MCVAGRPNSAFRKAAISCRGREIKKVCFGKMARGKVVGVVSGQARLSVEKRSDFRHLYQNVLKLGKCGSGIRQGRLQGVVRLIDVHKCQYLRGHRGQLPVAIPKNGTLQKEMSLAATCLTQEMSLDVHACSGLRVVAPHFCRTDAKQSSASDARCMPFPNMGGPISPSFNIWISTFFILAHFILILF